MQCQPLDAVERMLLVGCNEGSNAAFVFILLFGWLTVVSSAVYAQGASELFPPSWLDFIQNG